MSDVSWTVGISQRLFGLQFYKVEKKRVLKRGQPKKGNFTSIKRDYSPPAVDHTCDSACGGCLVFLCLISQPLVSPRKSLQIIYLCVLVLSSVCGVVLPHHREITVSEMFYYIARLQFFSVFSGVKLKQRHLHGGKRPVSIYPKWYWQDSIRDYTRSCVSSGFDWHHLHQTCPLTNAPE